MGATRSYDIFPRTWKMRVLLGLGFAGGLVAMVAYFAVTFASAFTGPFDLAPWNFWDKTEITIENRTDQVVRVYVDDELEATLQPGQTDTIKDFRFLWWTDRVVEAWANGRLAYSANLDYDELEEMNFRIVIDDR